MSLVVRVMSEAVEKSLISEMLKLRTWRKKSARTSRAKALPMRAESRPERKAPTAVSKAKPTIIKPVCQTKSRSPATIPSLTMSAISAGNWSEAQTCTATDASKIITCHQ